MIKHKFLWVFTLIGLIYFNLAAFAGEMDLPKTNYPDYSYEFVGNDKFESFNRKVFNFNLKANKYVIRPINIVWASVMPQYGMDRIQSFYTNANYPVRLVGCLLQKDLESSKSETFRFLTNSTIGVLGLYDPAQTKYNVKPRNENIEQALAYNRVKKGPYLVLPIVAQGNLRNLVGQALDLPLNPTSYIVGPVALASTGVSLVNDSTSMQYLFKMADSCADPYDVSKQLDGLDKYIKNYNLDRNDYLKENAASSGLVKINNVSGNAGMKSGLKADIELANFNPQTPLIDSMRTIRFDNKVQNDSKWSELSVWNRSFIKKIKTASVNVYPDRPDYKYRYVMQKDTTSPVAIIFPSIGEGIMSGESVVQAKILYDEGYSVIILGSAFQWEFVKSMPKNYRPGFPAEDAKCLRITTSKILNNLQSKNSCLFDKKIIVGTSFGALTSLFTAAQEENDNILGVSNYIAINPPVEIFYALKQLDKYTQGLNDNKSNLPDRAAITAEKIMQVSQSTIAANANNNQDSINKMFPLVNDEARLAIGYVMRQKLSDVIFTIENQSTNRKCDLYKTIHNMSFYEYAKTYLFGASDESVEQLTYESSLYSLAGFLKEDKKYKIYHSMDDCFVNPEQLVWLKKQTNNRSVFFSNGAHLGFLYRPEFLNEFKKDTELNKIMPKQRL